MFLMIYFLTAADNYDMDIKITVIFHPWWLGWGPMKGKEFYVCRS